MKEQRQVNLANLANGGARSNLKLPEGEERLAIEVNPIKIQKSREILIIGADVGSTQTRIFPIRDISELEEIDITDFTTIPSAHAVISKDRSLRTDDTVYDKMDSLIVDLKPSDFVIGGRVVRGNSLGNSGAPVIELTSTKKKTANAAYYNNIIDGIGYSLILQAIENNEDLSSEYEIYGAVSLPPDILQDEIAKESFRKNILKPFQWTHKPTGVTITLNFKGITMVTEPEATVKAFISLGMTEVDEDGTILCFEGGGSTWGVELISGFTRNDTASRSFQYGGKDLAKSVMDIENRSGRSIKFQPALEALKTGSIKSGRNTIDISDSVKQAKELMGKKVFKDFQDEVLSGNDNIALNEISTIIFSGKLNRAGEYDYPISDTILNEFDKTLEDLRFKKKGEEAPYEVVSLEENYTPIGTLLVACMQFQNVFQDQLVQETSTIEANSEEEVAVTNTDELD